MHELRLYSRAGCCLCAGLEERLRQLRTQTSAKSRRQLRSTDGVEPRGHERGVAPVEEFDSLNLRSGSHDMKQRGAYLSNRFVDDTMLEMGGIAPHGRFVHVYINGNYNGQYHLRERWNAAMHASYFGGNEEDYDAINRNDNFTNDAKAFDGNQDYW